MSQTILGIDLGTWSVKVLQLVRRVQELEILNFIEEPLPQHARFTHDEQIAAALDAIFKNHILTSDIVCVSLPGHILSSRILELPFTSIKKINQIADFELEGSIPFPIEDIFSDYHVLTHQQERSQVLCAYLKEDELRKYHDKFRGLGIDPKYLGADFSDLAAVAQIAMVPHEGRYAICDIGHSKTNFLIMEGLDLKYVRTIGVGGVHFTRAVQRAYNLNFEKAESLKLSRGKLCFREEDSDQVAHVLNKVGGELLSAIKQTLLGSRKFLGDASLAAVYCCGGGSRLIGIRDYLSFHLHTNVFELDTLNYIQHHFEDAKEINPVIPQVLATGIRSIYSARVPRINFRKGPYAFKQEIQVVASELKIVAGYLLAIILIGTGYFFYASHHYSRKMMTVEDRIHALVREEFRELEEKQRGKASLGKYLKDAKNRLKELRGMSLAAGAKKDNVITAMFKVSRALPPKNEVNFEVKELNFADDFLRLDAMTNDTLNVEKIVGAFNQSGYFASIESTDAQPKPGNVWDFTLKIDLKQAEETTPVEDEE